VRLVSATNRDLDELVMDGKFREDLFFRIKGVELHLPRLASRREDISLLVQHFLRQYAQQFDKPVPHMSDDVMLTLTQHDWPGNVRQLINVVQQLVIVAEDGRIEPRHLPAEIGNATSDDTAGGDSMSGMSLEQLEKHAIRNALRVSAGNREQAAKMLGIGERTLYRKLKEYGLK